jgi:hypothetical protein
METKPPIPPFAIETVALAKNTSMQPFIVEISQQTLDDLHERLARTRWPDEGVTFAAQFSCYRTLQHPHCVFLPQMEDMSRV